MWPCIPGYFEAPTFKVIVTSKVNSVSSVNLLGHSCSKDTFLVYRQSILRACVLCVSALPTVQPSRAVLRASNCWRRRRLTSGTRTRRETTPYMKLLSKATLVWQLSPLVLVYHFLFSGICFLDEKEDWWRKFIFAVVHYYYLCLLKGNSCGKNKWTSVKMKSIQSKSARVSFVKSNIHI